MLKCGGHTDQTNPLPVDFGALCKRGGTMSFQKLAASAGITSPFETGCLETVVTRARDWLAQNA